MSGRTVTDHISTRRLFHTILSAAGVAMDEEAPLSLEHTGIEPTVFIEAPLLNTAIANIEQRKHGLLSRSGYHRSYYAVYAEDHKLIIANDSVALYAVKDDPLEQHDLALLHPKKAHALYSYFQSFLKNAAFFSGVEREVGVDQRLRGLGYM